MSLRLSISKHWIKLFVFALLALLSHSNLTDKATDMNVLQYKHDLSLYKLSLCVFVYGCALLPQKKKKNDDAQFRYVCLLIKFMGRANYERCSLYLFPFATAWCLLSCIKLFRDLDTTSSTLAGRTSRRLLYLSLAACIQFIYPPNECKQTKLAMRKTLNSMPVYAVTFPK